MLKIEKNDEIIPQVAEYTASKITDHSDVIDCKNGPEQENSNQEFIESKFISVETEQTNFQCNPAKIDNPLALIESKSEIAEQSSLKDMDQDAQSSSLLDEKDQTGSKIEDESKMEEPSSCQDLVEEAKCSVSSDESKSSSTSLLDGTNDEEDCEIAEQSSLKDMDQDAQSSSLLDEKDQTGSKIEDESKMEEPSSCQDLVQEAKCSFSSDESKSSSTSLLDGTNGEDFRPPLAIVKEQDDKDQPLKCSDTEIITPALNNSQLAEIEEVSIGTQDLSFSSKIREEALPKINRKRKITASLESSNVEPIKTFCSNFLETSELQIETTENFDQEDSGIVSPNNRTKIKTESEAPPKNMPSRVLYITNLVRPFTLNELKIRLGHTGRIVENGFWTDSIKSKCYVCYETIEEAEATRSALHGIHWPVCNVKKLVVQFSTLEDFESSKNSVPVAKPVVRNYENLLDRKLTRKPEVSGNYEVTKSGKDDMRKLSDTRRLEVDERVTRRDLGKSDFHSRRSRSRGESNCENAIIPIDRKRSSTPPKHPISKNRKIQKDGVIVKSMDDLFQRTKVKPYIYWFALTSDEITSKKQQRLQKIVECKQKMEASRRDSDREIRGRQNRS